MMNSPYSYVSIHYEIRYVNYSLQQLSRLALKTMKTIVLTGVNGTENSRTKIILQTSKSHYLIQIVVKVVLWRFSVYVACSLQDLTLLLSKRSTLTVVLKITNFYKPSLVSTVFTTIKHV